MEATPEIVTSTKELASVVVGRVLQPGDGGYDEARRIWNGRFDRLAQLKQEWDPHNLFRVNHNVEPR